MTSATSAAGAPRVLWVGELETWMNEDFVRQMFATVLESVTQIRLHRPKMVMQGPPQHAYAFVEFTDNQTAVNVLNNFNNQPLPSYPTKRYKLNWAQQASLSAPIIHQVHQPSSGGISQPHDADKVLSIFVGDLAHEVTEEVLFNTFKHQYPSTCEAQVKIDPLTGRSKCYGFVRFSDPVEGQRAMSEMNQYNLMGRALRISAATPKKTGVAQPQMGNANAYNSAYFANDPNANPDIQNTQVFIGNLSEDVTPDQLRAVFSAFGEVTNVKIPFGKACGFVSYNNHQSAENAIQRMNGQLVGRNAIRTSWGKHGSMARPNQMGWNAQGQYGMNMYYGGNMPQQHQQYGGYWQPAYADPFNGHYNGAGDPYAQQVGGAQSGSQPPQQRSSPSRSGLQDPMKATDIPLRNGQYVEDHADHYARMPWRAQQ